MRTKAFTKLLALSIALIMVLGVLPLSVFADSDTEFSASEATRFFIVSDSDPTKTDLGNFVQLIDSEFAAKGVPSLLPLPIVYGEESSIEKGDIVVKIDSALASQSYKIKVAGDKVTVTGGDVAGAYYGLTVLLQMFEKSATLSSQTVENTPLVAERSAYIDCGRVYFTPDILKALIKTLSWNRMNTLYLDFSNNNATRFFLDDMNVTVDGTTYDITKAKPSDGKYLTQEDMEGIIEVAKQYGVQIIPTFNSPGHIGGLISLNKNFFDVGTATDYDRNCGKVTLLITDSAAYEFGQKVVKLYVDYFAALGCTSFNIAADEATLGNVKYDSTNATFVKYVNELNSYIKSKGMTTRMFNDGIKSVTSDIDKDIVVLYWAPENTAESLHKNGYQVVNFSYGAGLYFAYGASWWVWNQPVKTIYDGWTPGVLCRNTGDAYQNNYVATETTDPSNLLGANFAVWTDYAFNSNVSGDTIITSNNSNVMQKILIVGDRSWKNSSTAEFGVWSNTLAKTAPGGITVNNNTSGCAIDTTALPTASAITRAVKLIDLPAADSSVNVVVNGEDGQKATLAASEISSAYRDELTKRDAEKILSYDVTPSVDGVKYTAEGTVSMPVPAEWQSSSDRIRAYIITDGSVQLISGSYADGYYTFKVPHFSEMGLILLTEDAVENLTPIKVAEGEEVTRTVDGEYSVTFEDDIAKVTTSVKDKEVTPYYEKAAFAEGMFYVSATAGDKSPTAQLTFESDGNGKYYIKEASGSYVYPNASLYTEWLSSRWDYSTATGKEAVDVTVNADGSVVISRIVSATDWWNNNTKAYLTLSGSSWGASGSETALYLYTQVTPDAGKQTVIRFTGKSMGTTFVKIGDVKYEIHVTEKQIVDGNIIELPISIIDYRADGLLFDFQVGGATYDYGLVHNYDNDGSINSINGGTLSGTSYGTRIAGTTLENTGYVSSDSYSGNYYLWGNKWSRSGMVESKLGSNGMPVYTSATVARVAQELSAGNYNSSEMADVANSNDIIYSTFIESGKVVGSAIDKMSDAFSAAKTWSNINNAYDLAWYLLNTFYLPDTNMVTVKGVDGKDYSVPIYGMAVNAYSRMILRETSSGVYSLDAASGKVKYDTANGAIYEDDTASSKQFYPIDGLGYDAILGDTTDKSNNSNDNRPDHPNGNYSLRGEAQFVYKDGLYFEFSGDDDVYLFINGVLVLDLGGAHGVCTKRIDLSTVKEKCGLAEGEVATFTFFYMERNSDASNFKIETNIQLAERDIGVEKKAYDTGYGNEIPNGMSVATGRTVAYDLIVTNKGDSKLSNISFIDTDSFGGSASFGYGVTDASVLAGNVNNNGNVKLGMLGSFVVYITDKNGNEVTDSRKTYAKLAELSEAVGKVTLESGCSLHVRFLSATFNVADAKILSYLNTVNVTAYSDGQKLTAEASHELYSYNTNDTTRDYVVDFGLPLEIKNIFDEIVKNRIVSIKLSSTTQLKYGTLTTNFKGYDTTLTYNWTHEKTMDSIEMIILDVSYKMGDGAYVVELQKVLRIIPASTVYYEDSFVNFTNGQNKLTNAKWGVVGTKKNVNQALEKLGESGLYGTDNAYADSTEYSMGSAHKVTVTNAMFEAWKAGANKQLSDWPQAKFTFKGTGFDIISLTDNTSGAIYVDIYKGTDTSKDAVVGYVVNNYYGYSYDKETDTWTPAPSASSNNALYQIPVIKAKGLEYGEYTVVVTCVYSNFYDKTGEGEYSFWLDAIRVYDPLGKDNENYVKDKEGYPQFIELSEQLRKSNFNGLVFIDGKEEAEITDYKNYGPNHEVYLANGQALAFSLSNLNNVASVQLALKAVNGPVSYTINGEKQTVSTATDMYYDITEVAKAGTVVITNTGDNILSLTNVKVTFTVKPSTEVTMAMTEAEKTQAVEMVRAMFAPAVFEPSRFEAAWSSNNVKAGRRAYLTVKTSADVDAITVNGETVTTYITRTERKGWGWNATRVTYREFIWSVTAEETADYTVAAVNSEGVASEPVTVTLTVQPKKQQSSWWDRFSRWF